MTSDLILLNWNICVTLSRTIKNVLCYNIVLLGTNSDKRGSNEEGLNLYNQNLYLLFHPVLIEIIDFFKRRDYSKFL